MNTNLRGIAFLLVSGMLLSLNDAIFKYLAPHFPPGQILFTVATLVSLCLGVYLKFGARTGIIVNNRWWHLFRGLMFVAASFAFIIALNHMPLAELVAIAFAGPLFMTLMAKVFLKEQVGLYRVAAVVVGFIGVLVIIQPGTTSFEWVLLLPLVVALGDAGRDILTRKMAPTEHTLSIVFTTFAVMATVSLFSAAWGWHPVSVEHMLYFALATALTIVSYFCMVEAYRFAPASVVAPFRYIQIIWSILLGYLIWGEVPRDIVYLGIAITVGAGLFIAYRETLTLGKRSAGEG